MKRDVVWALLGIMMVAPIVALWLLAMMTLTGVEATPDARQFVLILSVGASVLTGFGLLAVRSSR